jgi:probable rRNA maturation factor
MTTPKTITEAMTGPTITVEIEDERWATALADPTALATEAALAALAAACPGLTDGLAVVLLADDATLQDLNRTWRSKDKPTNVLSFPATETRAGDMPAPEFDGIPLTLGDLALGYETIAAEAEAQGKSLAQHLGHLVVHGTLHLLGYDHEGDADARRMETLEIRILSGIGIPDPYGDHDALAAPESADA